MKNFKFVKETKNSLIYENEKYQVRLKTGAYAFPPKGYCDDEEVQLVPFDILIVKNKETQRKAQTRVFQRDPLSDLDFDYTYKQHFKKSIWDKID